MSMRQAEPGRVAGILSIAIVFILWGLLSQPGWKEAEPFASSSTVSAAVISDLRSLHPEKTADQNSTNSSSPMPEKMLNAASADRENASSAWANNPRTETENTVPTSIVALAPQRKPLPEFLTQTGETKLNSSVVDEGEENDDLWLIEALNGGDPNPSTKAVQDQESDLSALNQRPSPEIEPSVENEPTLEIGHPSGRYTGEFVSRSREDPSSSIESPERPSKVSSSRNEKKISLWQPNPAVTPQNESGQNIIPQRLASVETRPRGEGTEVTEAIAPTTTPMPTPTSSPMPSQQINGHDVSVFKLAASPQLGDVFHHHPPQMDARAVEVPPSIHDFDPGPCYGDTFNPTAEMGVYEGKTLNATQRPFVELGKPWYQLGPIPEPKTFLGLHNPVDPQFVIFGDSRIAAAANRNVGDSTTLLASQTNLFFDLKLTGTERFNVFVSPFTQGANNSRFEFDNDRFVSEANFDFINGFFEGDLGAIWGGLTNKTMPFDLPVAIGVMPLLFQNGVWMEDNILGVAATIPARNIPQWNVTNMDVTFFAGYDNIESLAFDNDSGAARIYGIATFIEAWNGYLELDYAFLDDRNDVNDRSYHNFGAGYSRRLGRFLSNSNRIIVNAGQDTDLAPGTADGVLLLSENSLITSSPSNVVPYLNLFAGFDRPQSAGRNGAAGGILRNTGILFESDNLTGYPTLEATANNTFGAAMGLNLISSNFGQQLIVESAFLGVMEDLENRVAAGSQYGVGLRYQLPLTHSVLLRTDAMYGWLGNSDDINGVRVELRRKF